MERTIMVEPCWARVRGPLAPYVDGFRAELGRQGYTPLTAAGHVRLVAHLSRWMLLLELSAEELTPPVVVAYFEERRAAGYVNSVTPRSLRPLVDYLERLGVAAVWVSPPGTETDRLLERFGDYLGRERGLAASTVTLNVRLVRPFLETVAGPDGELDLARLRADAVTGFVVAQSRARPGSVKRMVTALRSLLGFLHVEGMTAVGLGAAIPMTARAPGRLPDSLTVEQVAALLASCDRDSVTGRRDTAILTVLARLGLRAGEVAGLVLEDIDWRRGLVTVTGKGNRHDVLPLPADVGAAVVDWLRDRPVTAAGRTVFVRANAPHTALTSMGVTAVVARAGHRAGLGTVHAHRLRHAAATNMLAAGGSLAEIGQVLRHQRPATTAVYANPRELHPTGEKTAGREVRAIPE
jgi:site-specific recombinase XerD